MRRGRLRGGLVIALAVALAGGGVAVAAGSFSTVVQTIQDRDRDNVLERAPGEDYLVRDELGQALPGRERRRQELTFLAQMTDFQMNDEESPARVEFLDKLDRPFTTAYRPQEGTTTQVVNEMVRELRNTRSRVTHEGLDLVMTTGDNTDNTLKRRDAVPRRFEWVAAPQSRSVERSESSMSGARDAGCRAV